MAITKTGGHTTSKNADKDHLLRIKYTVDKRECKHWIQSRNANGWVCFVYVCISDEMWK